MKYEDAKNLISDVMLVTVTVLLLLPVQVLRCIRSSRIMSKMENPTEED